jgi:hypothetical protein
MILSGRPSVAITSLRTTFVPMCLDVLTELAVVVLEHNLDVEETRYVTMA